MVFRTLKEESGSLIKTWVDDNIKKWTGIRTVLVTYSRATPRAVRRINDLHWFKRHYKKTLGDVEKNYIYILPSRL